MSWTAVEDVIKTQVETLSYSRLPDNDSLSDVTKAHLHQGYTLRATGTDDRVLTNESAVFAYAVELKACYINTTNTTRNTNFDSFVTLRETIHKLTNFGGWITMPEVEDRDNKTLIGTLKFYAGNDVAI
jgi:hypothetical protein